MKKQSRSVSKLLELAITRYQFDVVGWTRFCNVNNKTKQSALPPDKSESLEILRIQDKLSTSISTLFSLP